MELSFKELANLLNHSKNVYIDIEPDPSKSRDGRWSVFDAYHSVHTSRYPFKLLYLTSKTSAEDVRNALALLARDRVLHVLHSPSLPKPAHRELTASTREGLQVWTIREYLLSYIQDEIKQYLGRLRDLAPEHFVDPPIETPSGFRRTHPNPVMTFLTDPDSASAPLTGRIGVVLAEAGQGKTYLSRYIVASLAHEDRKVVPLLVDSSQWQTMSLGDQASLAKTITHSFRHFGATIGWLEGVEDQFLSAMLKADVFRIVFDGFDEYVLRGHGSVQPQDAIQSLIDLASENDTRLVVTTRSSYWTSSLDDDTRAIVTKSGGYYFNIEPFDKNQATKFFVKRLEGDQKAVSKALEIYSQLLPKSKSMVGRGFVLSLIADVASNPPDPGSDREERAGPILWLVRALCDREVRRHNLPYSAVEQVGALRRVSAEMAKGIGFCRDLLAESLDDIRPGKPPDEIESSIDTMQVHPVIGPSGSDDGWCFRETQVRIALLADWILGATDEELSSFVGKVSLSDGDRQDVSSMLVEFVQHEGNEGRRVQQVQRVVQKCAVGSTVPLSESAPRLEASRLAGSLALMAVEKECPKGTPHEERTAFLRRLVGSNVIEGLCFSGSIARFDFCGQVFRRCRFDRTAWASCEFDGETRFERCRFAGGVPLQHCKGFGRAITEDCIRDGDAEAVWEAERVRERIREYSRDDLRRDYSFVLNKFVNRGGIGLKSLDESNLRKGPIVASRHCDEILARIIHEGQKHEGPWCV